MHTEGTRHGQGSRAAPPRRSRRSTTPSIPATRRPTSTSAASRVSGGLFGFVLVFFFFCFGMGKVINNGCWRKQDGAATKWNHREPGATPQRRQARGPDQQPEMQQKELQQMTTTFPEPRLDIDDGNQATADLHAREDLLLEHYSSERRPAGNDPHSDRARDGADRAARVCRWRRLDAATTFLAAWREKPEVRRR
jgi:hypothetical protein